LFAIINYTNIYHFITEMLLWVVFLIITNMNYVACEVEDIPKNTSI